MKILYSLSEQSTLYVNLMPKFQVSGKFCFDRVDEVILWSLGPLAQR
ncbi:hypothetical protein HMPREF0577_0905 [Mobiluncus mulieris ATCC 35243]|nr:hypothetical protein HMPREF0577_0905 [Mobiluncus mulieris ATCC 35243]